MPEDYSMVSKEIAVLAKEIDLLTGAVKSLAETATKMGERITTAEGRIAHAVEQMMRMVQIVEGSNGQKHLRTEIELLKEKNVSLGDEIKGLKAEIKDQGARRWQVIMWAISGGGGAGLLIALLTKVL